MFVWLLSFLVEHVNLRKFQFEKFFHYYSPVIEKGYRLYIITHYAMTKRSVVLKINVAKTGGNNSFWELLLNALRKRLKWSRTKTMYDRIVPFKISKQKCATAFVYLLKLTHYKFFHVNQICSRFSYRRHTKLWESDGLKYN